MSEQWACNRCNTSAGQNMAACPNCGLLRGAEAPAAGELLVAGGADSGVPAPGTVAHSWSDRVGPLLRWLTVGLWFALALAGLAIALEAPRYTPAFVIAFLLAPPVAVGLACLFIRGRGIAAGIALLSVAVIGIGVTFFLGVLAQLDEQPEHARELRLGVPLLRRCRGLAPAGDLESDRRACACEGTRTDYSLVALLSLVPLWVTVVGTPPDSRRFDLSGSCRSRGGRREPAVAARARPGIGRPTR